MWQVNYLRNSIYEEEKKVFKYFCLQIRKKNVHKGNAINLASKPSDYEVSSLMFFVQRIMQTFYNQQNCCLYMKEKLFSVRKRLEKHITHITVVFLIKNIPIIM